MKQATGRKKFGRVSSPLTFSSLFLQTSHMKNRAHSRTTAHTREQPRTSSHVKQHNRFMRRATKFHRASSGQRTPVPVGQKAVHTTGGWAVPFCCSYNQSPLEQYLVRKAVTKSLHTDGASTPDRLLGRAIGCCGQKNNF